MPPTSRVFRVFRAGRVGRALGSRRPAAGRGGLRTLPAAALAFVALVGTGRCSSDSSGASSPAAPSPPPATSAASSLRPPGTTVLAVGQSVRVEGRDASVRFVRVAEDSRCPQGVECVWAGRARVEIELTVDGRPARALTLEVGAGPVEESGLRFVAESLEPPPRAETPTAEGEYRLRLRVEPSDG
jgi:hypothetical protein